MPPKKRKEKTDILFSFMTLLLNRGSRGVTANASLAREYNWSVTGLHNLIGRLCKSEVVICTSKGQDKHISLKQGILTHSDWILEFYGEKVPPRYMKYLDMDAKPEINEVIMAEKINDGERLFEDVKKLLDERDTLVNLVASLKEAVMVRDSIIGTYKKILSDINRLSYCKE